MTPELTHKSWERSPDALFVYSADGTILQWTPGAEMLFGHREDEAIGASLFELIVPKDRVGEEKRIQADARRYNRTVHESVRLRKDGSLVHVSLSTEAVRDGCGRLEHYLCAMKDVTLMMMPRDSQHPPVFARHPATTMRSGST